MEDSRSVFDIFRESVLDLASRTGVETITGSDDPGASDRLWKQRRPLFEHLAKTASHFWIAEEDGAPIGYARTTERDGMRELTEFFVLPGSQSAGVGRELFRRAFPEDWSGTRVIIATLDERALARYLRAGLAARFPIKHFSKPPQDAPFRTDLTFHPLAEEADPLGVLSQLDSVVLGHRRDLDHVWLAQERRGYVFRRGGKPVGYGYAGELNGPFAFLNPEDAPTALALAESQAFERGQKSMGVEVPLVNQAATSYLLDQGFSMDAFTALFLSDREFGKFENYIFSSPPFFL